MRLCIVTGTFHPEIGGPPRYLLALGQTLQASGHQVRVICMSPAGVHGDAPGVGEVHRVSRGWPVPVRLACMLGLLLRHAPWADLLLISDYGLPPALANLLLRRPAVIRIAGDFAWEYSRRHGHTALDIDTFQATPQRGTARLLQRLQRWYVSRCQRVLVPSRYLARMVAGWGIPRGRIRVIPNAVERGPWQEARLDAETRRRLQLPGRYLLTVARLTPWKGVDHLIDCLPRLPEDLHLVVVGEGPEECALRERALARGAAARTHFLGALAQGDVASCMAGALALVLYTGYEGLSHVLLEALAAGLPVVASRKGGNLEVLEDGESGILVPYEQPEALLEALQVLCADASLRQRLARGAVRRSRDFRMSGLVEETLALLEEVART